MRENLFVVFFCFSLIIPSFAVGASSAQAAAPAPAPAPEKEWTFLVFLNGKNSLDRFGPININQMEQVGSNDHVNVIVQWGSISNGKTQRLYIQKDNDTSKVTSPVIQDMGSVDMGDWHTLAEFIRWGAQNYPAKHYFVDVWDHGSGWHAIQSQGLGSNILHPTDISWDDQTNSFMTTKQLGQAISEGARAVGHKIDVFGSDACLMASAEVAAEMKDTVAYYVGSQDLEPGAGWPYDTLLQRWEAKPVVTPREVAIALTEEYTKSYQGGTNGTSEVTMSAYDLSKQNSIEQAFKRFGVSLRQLDKEAKKKAHVASSKSASFTYMDYVDVIDFLKQLEVAKVGGISSEATDDVRKAVHDYVISNRVTSSWAPIASGISIWLPQDKSTFDSFSSRYAELDFQTRTDWSSAVQDLIPAAASRH